MRLEEDTPAAIEAMKAQGYVAAELATAAEALAKRCDALPLIPYADAKPTGVAATLNAAWTEVLERPASYAAWEATALGTLLAP